MTTVEDRRREQERVRQASRERAKRAKAPVIIDIDLSGLEAAVTLEDGSIRVDLPPSIMKVPLSEQFAPIIQRTGDERLISIAKKYKLPLTKEQEFLIETGDRFLDQYRKRDIPEEEITQLYQTGWNPLVSSNLKAVRVDGEDLQILFHSEAVYKYPDKANMYYPFSEALSPGRLLWRTIRTMRGYQRIA
jgi:hypothetical protein